MSDYGENGPEPFKSDESQRAAYESDKIRPFAIARAMEFADCNEMSGDLRVLLTRMHGTAKALKKYAISLEELYRRDGDRIADLEQCSTNIESRLAYTAAENERLKDEAEGMVERNASLYTALEEAIIHIEGMSGNADQYLKVLHGESEGVE